MDNLQSRENINRIHEFCIRHKIGTHTINNDGSINVLDNVKIIGERFIDGKLPIRFNIVKGDFSCTSCALTSTEGFPNEVSGEFNCSHNNLTSLEYGPAKVGGKYQCHNNHLTTLENTPQYIHGDFICTLNHLTNLKGGPAHVNGKYFCDLNNLTTLEGSPDRVAYNFNCSNNKLTSLKYIPKQIGSMFDCSDNLLTSLEYLPMKIKVFSKNNTKLPREFLRTRHMLDRDQQNIFDRYVPYYDIWNNGEMDSEALKGLYDDIIGGLQ